MDEKPQKSLLIYEPSGGRFKIMINWDVVHKMANYHSPVEEIADVLGIGLETLRRRCREDFDQTLKEHLKPFYAAGKADLRRMQVAVAMTGDVTMLKHLGKYLLGQDEKVVEENKPKRKALTLNYKLRE